MTLARSGHDVLTENDSKRVQARLGEQPVDLLILDIMMPDIDGLDLCERIRAAGNDLPILFLTARSGQLDILTGYAAGAQAYLTKPFNAVDLLEKVRYCLAPRP